MKKFLVIAAVALLASCTPKVYTKFVYVPIEVPEKYLICKQMEKADYPDPEKLTDDQTASLLNTAVGRLKFCGTNMKAAKEFIVKAKKLAAEKNKAAPVLNK
jgi:hypothetical protein